MKKQFMVSVWRLLLTYQEVIPVFIGTMTRTKCQHVIIKMQRRQVKGPFQVMKVLKDS